MSRPRDRSRSAVPRSRESLGSGDDLSPAWRQAWVRREGFARPPGTCTRFKGDYVTSPTTGAASAPALPDYAPVPRSSLGPALNDQGYCVGRVERNLYAGASSLFDRNVVRIGHEETRRLLLRDNDPARPAPEVTFQDRYTLEVAGE